MLEKEEAYMALDLVTPFTKVQLEEEIKDTGRKQVGILGEMCIRDRLNSVRN